MNSKLVFAAAARRLGRRPRLATAVLRLPRFLPRRPRSFLYRWFSWPLAKRLKGEPVVSVTGGSRMRVHTVDSIGRVLAISGVWEPNVTAAFREHVSRGDVCVDIGAHIGYFTLLASKLVGSEGHVYAFEPSPSNYEALRANLALNGVTNVTALPVAVGETAGTARLYEGPGTNTGHATLRPSLVDESAVGVMVEVRPLVSSIVERDLRRIRVIKIDVEGYELEVLRSLEPVFELGGRLAVFVEFSPAWIEDADATHSIEHLCRNHQFMLRRVPGNYSLTGLFPGKLDEPTEVDSIPADQCDLLLVR